MSPIVKLPIYFYDPKIQRAEMREFLSTFNVSSVEIEVLIPKNIYLVTVDFRYRKEWKLFCEKFWGEKYFYEYLKKPKNKNS